MSFKLANKQPKMLERLKYKYDIKTMKNCEKINNFESILQMKFVTNLTHFQFKVSNKKAGKRTLILFLIIVIKYMMDYIGVFNKLSTSQNNRKQCLKMNVRFIMTKSGYQTIDQNQNSDIFFTPYHELIDKKVIIKYSEKRMEIKLGFCTLKKTQKLSRMKSIRNYLEYCYLIKQLNRMKTYQCYTYQIQSNGNVYLSAKIDCETIFSNHNIIYFLEHFILSMEKYFYKQQHIIKAMILFQYEYLAQRVYNDQKKQIKQQLFKLKNQLEQLRSKRKTVRKIKTEQYALISKQNVLNSLKFVSQSFVVADHINYFIRDIPFPFINDIYSKYKPKIPRVSNQKKQQINRNAICLGIGMFQKKKTVPFQIASGTHSTIELFQSRFTVISTLFQQKNSNSISEKNENKNDNQIIMSKPLIKKMPKSTIIKSESYNSFLNEKKIIKHMRNNQCPYICQYFIYAIQSKNSFYLEFHKANLRRFIAIDMKKPLNQKKFPISMKLQIMKGIASGIYFLQYNRLLHRDLKPQNILLDQNFIPKIIDFGSSCSQYNSQVVKVQEEALLSTRNYYYEYSKCDPYIQQTYHQEAYEMHILFDSYSLGVIVQQLFQLNKNIDSITQKESIIVQYLNYIRDRCKDQDPNDRLSGEQIVTILVLLLKYQKDLQLLYQKKTKQSHKQR